MGLLLRSETGFKENMILNWVSRKTDFVFCFAMRQGFIQIHFCFETTCLKSTRPKVTMGLVKLFVSNFQNDIFHIVLQHSKKGYCSFKE